MTPIERLRELMAKATPGPWKWDQGAYRDATKWLINDSDYVILSCISERGGDSVYPSNEDGELIVSAINHLPALLAVVEAAQAVMDEHPAGYYYHGHRVPGIWDPDNGDLAGKACENCAKVFRLRKALAALTTEGQP
jgi:hypothetical protein